MGNKKRKWTIEQLKQSVASSYTFTQVIEKLGYKKSGSVCSSIKKIIQQLHIDTSHFTPWPNTTGLHTKESYEKMANKRRGKSLTKEHREKIKTAIQKKVKSGTWHISFSKARRYEYNDVQLHGKWEVAYAKYLDNENIKWRRPTESFTYIFEDSEHQYTPDFYLLESDTYVEIKGYPTEKDKSKWQQFTKKLVILQGKDLFNMGLITNFKKIT